MSSTTWKGWDEWDNSILVIKIDPNFVRPKDSVWDFSTPQKDEGRSFGARRTNIYTTPVNFVSGGLRPTAEEERQQQEKGGDGPSSPPQSEEDIGGWEQHTKGIGLAIMLKMGYEPGKGLGKYHQGILKPIDVKLQMGKEAFGYRGNESLPDFPVINPEEKTEKKFEKELGQRCKDPAGPGGKKPPKSSHKVKAKSQLAATSAGELAQVKVTDMAGREHMLTYSYSQMLDPRGSDFAFSELQRTLQLDLKEQDILQSARHLQHEEDEGLLVSLKRESRALQSRLDAKEAAIQRMEAVLSLVKLFLTEEVAPGEGPTQQECTQIFETLRTDFYEECMMMGLTDLPLTVVHP